ncbi:MAG: DUF4974 domain-containing protein [Chitinophagaceae bacterium]|nr:DUF4974 domain-containing protein [Chitinophagaceae bacterium]
MDEKHVDYSIYIAGLIYQYRNGSLSGEALTELNAWIAANDSNRLLFEELTGDDVLFDELLKMENEEVENHVQRIVERTGAGSIEEAPLPAIGRSRKKWYWIAAALFFAVLSVAAFYFIDRQETAGTLPHYATHPLIQPGKDKAILQLADGTQIPLDSSPGDIANQQHLTIKNDSGTVIYMPAARLPGNALPSMHSIITPRGGQYQVVLPDGTHVWLNASSSITFPTAFAGTERRVEITGEAYFEVAEVFSSSADHQKGKNKVPFIVDINMPSGTAGEVLVLGTHFNINAYPDESAIKTTLVEGAVTVRKGKESLNIRPGQQASMGVQEGSITTSYPDIEEVLAWKNGRFKFNNTDAVSIMRQIARWYDVEIKTEGDLSAIRFSGGISRKDDIEKLLEILESEGRVKFIRQGRNITVESSR